MSVANTVTVACKLPRGVELRIFEMVPVAEPVMGGGVRETKRGAEVGRIKLKGWWDMFPPGGKPVQSQPGSYGLTHGIDRDLFNKWVEQNKDSDLIKNKIVFGHEKSDAVEGRSRDYNPDIRSGAEPLNPALKTVNGERVPVDHRYPRRANGATAIEQAERQ